MTNLSYRVMEVTGNRVLLQVVGREGQVLRWSSFSHAILDHWPRVDGDPNLGAP
jgi:hypothetical protein